MNKTKQVSVMDCLGFYTQIKEVDLIKLINKAPSSYRIYYVPKKKEKPYSNFMRKICQPTIETKMLQYALLNYYFMDIEESKCAMAYIQGLKSPTLKNAIKHKNFLYTVHYDFADFFYSINSEVFFSTIKNDFDFTFDDLEKIKKICFIKYKGDYKLAIGSPIAPKFSNLYMREFDEKLKEFAITTNCYYTRYADDILYSTNDKNNIPNFKLLLDKILMTDKYSNLKINEKKTKIYKPNSSKRITGLIINSDGEIKVPRKIKRETRSLLFKNSLRTYEETLRLKGLIAYIKDVEPLYINKLVTKYKDQYFICMRTNKKNDKNIFTFNN